LLGKESLPKKVTHEKIRTPWNRIFEKLKVRFRTKPNTTMEKTYDGSNKKTRIERIMNTS